MLVSFSFQPAGLRVLHSNQSSPYAQSAEIFLRRSLFKGWENGKAKNIQMLCFFRTKRRRLMLACSPSPSVMRTTGMKMYVVDDTPLVVLRMHLDKCSHDLKPWSVWRQRCVCEHICICGCSFGVGEKATEVILQQNKLGEKFWDRSEPSIRKSRQHSRSRSEIGVLQLPHFLKVHL